VNLAELAQLLAPFVAVLTASAWLHGTIGELKTTIASLTERVRHLEAEVERLRNRRP
jgi:regulator of replication initiation timing